MMDTNTQRPKSRPWKRGVILVALPILVVAILVTLALPLLPSGGWSKDVAVSGGTPNMNMRIQFKTNPESPKAGPVTLMARIKEEGGFTSRVNELVFNYSAAGQQFAQSREGVPNGKFGTQGEGFYTADAELPFPGDWLVEVRINHGEAKFSSSFPLKVNQQ